MAWFLVQGFMINHEGGSPPGFGGGWGGGPRPGHDLPWGPGHPGNALPGQPVDPGWGGGWGSGGVDPGYGQGGGFRPDNSLPWAPGHPGNRPPGSYPGRPDQGLPGQPIDPGFGGGIGQQPGYPSGQPIIPGATPYGQAVATQPPAEVDPKVGAWVLVNVQGSLVWAWAQKSKQPETPPETAQPKK